MQLHGSFVDPEPRGDLLVHRATQDVAQDFELARSQPGEALAQLGNPGTRLVLRGLAIDCAPDGRKQFLLRRPLLQKIHGPPAHRTHTARDIAIPGEEHDGQIRTRADQGRLQLKTTHPGHRQICDDATTALRGDVEQQLGR